MRVAVDRDRCVSAGMCALTAPEVFDQDAGDGRVVLLDATPATGQHTSTRDAAQVCPSGAVTVTG